MGRKDGTTKRCPVTLRAGQRSIELAAGACPRREAVDLLSCLNITQCLSSISDFSNLIATVQTMRSLNPLQVNPVLSMTVSVLTIGVRCAVPFGSTNMK